MEAFDEEYVRKESKRESRGITALSKEKGKESYRENRILIDGIWPMYGKVVGLTVPFI